MLFPVFFFIHCKAKLTRQMSFQTLLLAAAAWHACYLLEYFSALAPYEFLFNNHTVSIHTLASNSGKKSKTSAALPALLFPFPHTLIPMLCH